MLRRHVAKAAFFAAGTSLLTKPASAQSCTAPCYAQSAAEITAGVTPTSYAYPPGDARRYGCKLDGVTPDNVPMQHAINYCIAMGIDLAVNGICLLTATINIDRQVDGPAYDNYFRIFSSDGGGGFKVNSSFATDPIAMFSSSIPFSTAPVSQLTFFEGISFIGNSGSCYVLDDGRFLRIRFLGCDFDKILLCNSSIYTQSYQITKCNIRRNVGAFFTSTGQTFDFKFEGNIVEAYTGNVLSLANVLGGAIIGNLMEGITGTAITYNGASSFAIHGNYFEGNALDIDGTGTTQASGVSLVGNFFDRYAAPTVYGVKWGNGAPINCVSLANHCYGKLHTFPVAGMDVLVKDSASVSPYDREPTPSFPTLFALNDGALGSSYGGVVKGYGITNQGGFLGLGVLNAGTYTEAITINNAAQVTANNTLLVKGDTPSAPAASLALGATQSTVASAGSIASPGNFAGFLQINIGGTFYKVPFFNN